MRNLNESEVTCVAGSGLGDYVGAVVGAVCGATTHGAFGAAGCAIAGVAATNGINWAMTADLPELPDFHMH